MTFDIGEFWRNKMAITVPQCTSDDSKCGLYAIGISVLCPDENPGRITKKLKEHIQKYSGGFECEFKVDSDVDIDIEGVRKVKFRKAAKDIAKFERLNPDLRIKVFGARTDLKTFITLKESESPNVTLMLFMNKSGICHWTVVRNFDRLCFGDRDTKSRTKRLFCDNCYTQYFYSKTKLEFHRELCLKNEVQKCTMPKAGEKCKFKNFKNMLFIPVVIYADFECYQHTTHTPSGHGLYVKSVDDDIFKSRYISDTFDGDVAKNFVDTVIEVRQEFDEVPVKGMELSDDETEYHIHSDRCWICELEFRPATVVKNKDGTEKKNTDFIKVRDHCHFTGRYRGPAHQKCNLRLRRQRLVPVLFHNLRGYDSHFLVKAFRGLEESIGGIPEGGQKFKMLSLKKASKMKDDGPRKYFSALKFLDSLQFKKKGLEKLAKEITEFPTLNSEFPKDQADNFHAKGSFPYEWFDSFKKLEQTKFPSHESFRSKVRGHEQVEINGKKVIVGKNISEQDYKDAKSVFKKYCPTMKDYHDLYMKRDILLLADIFENFRRDAYKYFKLDPLNYITLASFAWDCVLKFTKVELDLLYDMNMYLFYEDGKRGGYSNCHKFYSKANHKYLGTLYDPEKPKIFIVYWDINSMYATVMRNALPHSDFTWFTEFECDEIMELIESDRHHEIRPCTLMVDLSHDVKNIDREKVFAMCPEMFEDKLCHTLRDKKKYIVHHRALKKYIDFGMTVTKVHTGIHFTEKAWLKEYIEFCVEKRKQAKADGVDSLVEFWKSMMNEPYGKTMENVRNYTKFELINNEKKFRKKFTRPNFKEHITFSNDEQGFTVGVSMADECVELNKPIYTGQTILDDSKILMYEFIYDYCMKKWPDGKFKVLQTDTDSVIAEIHTDDLMFDIKDDIPEWFDTSSFLRTEFDTSEIPKMNSKVLGKLKDELCGQFITEFVGIAPKMYSYQYLKLDGTLDTSSVCKGVPKNAHPEFEEYRDLVLNKEYGTKVFKNCTRIQSKDHTVRTTDITKVAMTKEVRKRVRDENDEFETVPYGYYELLSKK